MILFLFFYSSLTSYHLFFISSHKARDHGHRGILDADRPTQPRLPAVRVARGSDRLTERSRYAGHSREMFDDVLELAERIAKKTASPRTTAPQTSSEPHLDDGRRRRWSTASGTHWRHFLRPLWPLPVWTTPSAGWPSYVVSMASFAFLQAANSATAGYAMLTIAAANLLIANGSRSRSIASSAADARRPLLRDDVPVRDAGRVVAGGYHDACRALSATAPIGCSARRCGSRAASTSSPRTSFTSCWPRSPGPAGVKGISLFIVPRDLVEDDGSLGERNDVVLAGLNHKMGFRGTVNTVLGFGDGDVHARRARRRRRLSGRRAAPRAATCST